MSMPIEDLKVLDAIGNYRAVFKFRDERHGKNKVIEQTSGFSSIRKASIAVQQIIDLRGYTSNRILGARIIDLHNFPQTVAFVLFFGQILDAEPYDSF